MSIRALVDRWASRPLLDLVAGILVAGTYALWRAFDGTPWVVLDSSSRGVLYAALAGTAAAILAFAITPIAIVLALSPGPRLQALLRHHSDELRRALLSLLWYVLALLTASLLALAVDTGSSESIAIRYTLLALGVATLLAVARMIRDFGLLLLNIGRDTATPAPLADISDTRRAPKPPHARTSAAGGAQAR